MNHGALGELCRALADELERDPKGPRVARLLADYAAANDDWRAFAHFDEQCYTRNLVFKDETFELLVVCWGVGQESPIHNHMGQNCWMAVLEGRIEEVQFAHEPDQPLVQRGAKTLERGAAAYICDEIGLHLVRSADERAGITLHLYSRPYATCLVYDPGTGEESQRALGYHSVDGVPTGGATA